MNVFWQEFRDKQIAKLRSILLDFEILISISKSVRTSVQKNDFSLHDFRRQKIFRILWEQFTTLKPRIDYED